MKPRARAGPCVVFPAPTAPRTYVRSWPLARPQPHAARRPRSPPAHHNIASLPLARARLRPPSRFFNVSLPLLLSLPPPTRPPPISADLFRSSPSRPLPRMAPSDSAEPCTQRPPAAEQQPAPPACDRAPAAGTSSNKSGQAPPESTANYKAPAAMEPAEKKQDRAETAEEAASSDSCCGGVAVARRPEESARERLKRHRTEMAGRVRIPDMWGQERLLKDWVDCAVFDRPLAATAGLLTARDALVAECAAARRPAVVVVSHAPAGRPLRVQNGCS
ncbi:hypothetical protein HU200_043488 [Digitaria exilis]|uniref:Protein BIC1 n=1 Tax=Digitaria exilis TaxID=1010633 RepID=A0A835B356_9POAL|nr:hypothetical protein HU200_043488 [Digitaria exilis]